MWPLTSNLNFVNKQAAKPVKTTKKLPRSQTLNEHKNKTLTKETSAKDPLIKKFLIRGYEKVNKEETNKITVRKLLSYAKPSASKEVKATKSETKATTPQRAPARMPNHQIPKGAP